MDRTVSGWVAGQVQGVYYRASFKAEADRLGLKGWVRNLADGRVEFFVRGAGSTVDAMLAWARQGPRGARVDQIHTADADDEDVPARFEIRT